jgi:hypothetical protein
MAVIYKSTFNIVHRYDRMLIRLKVIDANQLSYDDFYRVLRITL